MERLSLRMTEQIDSFHNEMNHISLQIISNRELMGIMKQADISGNETNYFTKHIDMERKVRDYLASFNGPELTVSRISMYNDRGDYVSVEVIPEDAEVVRSRLQSDSYKLWYQDFIGNDHISITGPHADVWSLDQSQKFISFYRPLRDVSETFGVIEIQQIVPKFDKILQIENDGGMQVYVFDKECKLIYKNQEMSPQLDAGIEQLHKRLQATEGLSETDHGYLNVSDDILSYRLSHQSGWMLVLAQSRSVLLEPIKVVGKLSIIASIIFVILSVIMVFFISSQLTRPLRKLRNSIRNVSMDNLTLEIDDASNEIILVKRTFNQMVDRLKDSMEQVVQARSRELKARMIALQSQMNPHFLYNVLSVIGAAGQQAGVDKVMELCEKLAGMLRYSSNYKGTQVTIHDELTYAQLYLDLMKQRYEDHFQYHLEADEETFSANVPRLILQPLIENCFHHAFQMAAPPWVIHISIKQSDEYDWMLEVKDWGSGFDPKALDHLRWRIALEDSSDAEQLDEQEQTAGTQGGIGIFNTLARLKLAFGVHFFFEILNNEPTGTNIRIGRKRI